MLKEYLKRQIMERLSVYLPEKTAEIEVEDFTKMNKKYYAVLIKENGGAVQEVLSLEPFFADGLSKKVTSCFQNAGILISLQEQVEREFPYVLSMHYKNVWTHEIAFDGSERDLIARIVKWKNTLQNDECCPEQKKTLVQKLATQLQKCCEDEPLIDAVLSKIADNLKTVRNMRRYFGSHFDDLLDSISDYHKVKKFLRVRVCNAEKNKDLLGTVPHDRMGDLVFLYQLHMPVPNSPGFECNCLIKNNFLQSCNVSIDELKQEAWLNTIKEEPVSLETIVDDCSGILIVTNKEKNCGAIAIFYPDVAKEISRKLHGNFYIIFSSIDECFILPKEIGDDIHDLRDRVCEANKECCEPERFLSDSIYYYDAAAEKILPL